MAIPNYTLLDEMLRVQQETGAAEILGTAHMMNALRAALAARRRRDFGWYGVKLRVENLPEEEWCRAETGGMVKLRLSLVERESGPGAPRVSGPQAARTRELGGKVDHREGVKTAAEREAERIGREYEEFCAKNPGAGFEEKCAAGFRMEALADELKSAPKRRKERGFFEELDGKLGTGEGEGGGRE